MNTFFFFSHSHQIKWYSVFADAIKECLPNSKILLFVHGKDDYSYAEQFESYDLIIDLINGFSFNPSLELQDLKVSPGIVALETDLDTSFFWEDMKVDRYIRAKDNPSFSIQYINFSFDVFEKVYQRERPVLGFGESTMAIYRLAHHAFDRDGLPYIAPISNRYSERFYFEDDWYWGWNRCLRLYECYRKDGIPDDLVKIVDDTYKKLVVRGTKHEAFNDFKKAHKVGYVSLEVASVLPKLILMVKNLVTLKAEYFRNNIRYSIIEKTLLSKVIRVIKNYYDHFKYSRLLSEQVISNQAYSIYFLHFQPEYTVDSLGKFYHDQVSLISNIASSIPADQILYVKEHPAMVGLRSSEYYTRIIGLTNVVLLHHDIDSLKLIKGAKIVFSIVGTVGLEATFYNKPSILFGRYAFSDMGTSSFCSSIWDLQSLIRRKLDQDDEDELEMVQVSKALFAAKYVGSYPAKIPFSDATVAPFFNDKEQHKLVVEAMRLELVARHIL